MRPAREAEPLDVYEAPLDGVRLIEASAGTGKTWAICGLYLRLLLERRLGVEQILVVTFTHAATAELRERIRSRLAELLAEVGGAGVRSADPFSRRLIDALRARGIGADEIARRVELALQSFDEAAIHTIHGFSQRALAEAPFTARLPLALETIADDSLLVAEVVADFWRTRLSGDALTAELVALLDQRRDAPARWAKLLRRHLARPLARSIWPAAIDDEPVYDPAALAAAHAAARATWAAQRDEVAALLDASRSALNGTRYKAAAIAEGAAQWDALFEVDDPLALTLARDKARLYTRGQLERCTNSGKTTPRHAFFDRAEALFAAHERVVRALDIARLRLLRDLMAEGRRALAERKRAARLVSFDDMLSQLHERLAGDRPELAATIRARFPAALIDEFQDTDPLQLAIFDAIYGRRRDTSLLLVGDPKQAIYGFRNADLPTYLRARAEAQTVSTLVENQRSIPELIGAINALFGANRRAFVVPGIDYRRVAAGAKPRRRFVDDSEPRGALHVWLLPSGGEPIAKRDALRQAVAATAAEIARLLGEAARGRARIDGRPLGAGDIAVLVRSHAQGQAMRSGLAAVGLGCVELSQASVFTTAEAQSLEALLAAILEPTNGGLLRAALATELLGADAAQVESLASDEAALIDCVARFAAYREVWVSRGIGVMLRQLGRDEGVARRLLPRVDGERRMTNLRHLVECLNQAAQTQRAPHALLRWLRAQRASDAVGEAAQMRLESDRHLVQIVTVHRSKGLEYPVVFCPFLYDGRLAPPPDGLDGCVTHDEDDRSVIDWCGAYASKAEEAAAKRRLLLETAAERMRLAYVALTRGVYRCYLVAGCYAIGRSTSESARAPLNWLVAGDGMAPGDWFDGKPDAQPIERAWASLAREPGIRIEPLARAFEGRVAVEPSAAPSLAALMPPRRIPDAWRIGSYSALIEGAGGDADAAQREREAEPAPAVPRIAAATVSDDIVDFPRGTEAGECLHAVLQRIDFGDRSGWPDAIAAALRAHPLHAARRRLGASAERWPAMIGRLLSDLMQTEIAAGLRLRGVAADRRLIELEFTLGSNRLAARDLDRLLREEGYPTPRLAFATQDGYLKGYIDLVFEHAGRFYLVDWKSNHLGASPADYAGAALGRAMAEHGYHLQQLIYAVALQRLLRRRIAGYDFDRHFGGVYYLFVRGVRPDWRAADGSPAGVHFHRPRAAVLDRLDALLAKRAGAARTGQFAGVDA